MAIAFDGVKPSDLTIRQSIIPAGNSNRPGSPLHPTNELWIINHETANENPGASAEMHRVFTHQGGGSSNVSFHLTVDDVEAIQLLPLDEIAYHASDGCDEWESDWCFKGIAIELCVNAPAGSDRWAKAKANLVALMAAIVKGDRRLDFGRTDPKRFSADRNVPHQRTAYDRKECPRRSLREGLIRLDGSGPIRDAVKRLVGNVKSYERVRPTPLWTGRDVRVGNLVWHAVRRKITTLKATTPRVYGSPKAAPSGPPVKAGTELEGAWCVTRSGMPVWWVTEYGSRIDANDIRERIVFSENKAA